MNHFNPIRNQNYPPFFQNSPFASLFWPLNRGLFLPRLLGPKRPHSKWALLAPKIGLYFTHRNGPIFGAKTDLLDLECRFDQFFLAFFATNEKNGHGLKLNEIVAPKIIMVVIAPWWNFLNIFFKILQVHSSCVWVKIPNSDFSTELTLHSYLSSYVT